MKIVGYGIFNPNEDKTVKTGGYYNGFTAKIYSSKGKAQSIIRQKLEYYEKAINRCQGYIDRGVEDYHRLDLIEDIETYQKHIEFWKECKAYALYIKDEE
jgi:hypothetical protein